MKGRNGKSEYLLLSIELHHQGQGTEELDFVVCVGEKAAGKLPSFSRLLESVEYILDLRNTFWRSWFI